VCVCVCVCVCALCKISLLADFCCNLIFGLLAFVWVRGELVQRNSIKKCQNFIEHNADAGAGADASGYCGYIVCVGVAPQQYQSTDIDWFKIQM